MDFIDLKSQQKRIRAKLMSRIERVLDHGAYIMGPEVAELETRLAKYVGVKHCISCASGTDALLMPLMAQGIGPGDAVFVPAFTFMATAEVVGLTGATPIFLDVDARTFNITAETLAAGIKLAQAKFPNLKPRAVIPVDLFGQPADYAQLNELAAKHNLFVLEDAAQAFGATYRGVKTCALAPCAATSFFPAKPLGCYGDGGAVFCNDDNLAALLRSIRVHGQGNDRYLHERLGLTARLDSLQAAVLLEKLEIFDAECQARNEVAARYARLLGDTFEAPKVIADATSVWAQYTLISEQRDKLVAALKAASIPVMIYYAVPLHLQKVFAALGYRPGDLPVCEELATTVFSLPMHPYLDEESQVKIASVLKAVA